MLKEQLSYPLFYQADRKLRIRNNFYIQYFIFLVPRRCLLKKRIMNKEQGMPNKEVKLNNEQGARNVEQGSKMAQTV